MAEANKILVVDDESVIRELLLDILADEDYEVEALSNGPDALDRLKQDDGFVLLFTDIMMPDMDGIELVREARKVRPQLIPVVMTGFATLESARAAVKEGVYDYVLKPFSLSEVKMAVSNAFERYHLANENARLLELTEIFKISESIAGIRDEKRLLDFVLRAALERVSAMRGSLMLTTPDGEALEVAASVGVPEELTKDLVKIQSSISGWVALHVQPLLVTDISKEPQVREFSHRSGDPSFVSVPLERKLTVDTDFQRAKQDGPEVLAVLNVSEKRNGQQFTEGDLKILNIISNHAAAALQNVRLIKDIQNAHMATLQSMALLLEAKDTYTHGHSQRVTQISTHLAKRLDVSDQEIDVLRVGAQFHDIGKVGVPDTILNKTDRLTDDEWQQIKRHPLIGYEILEPVTFLAQGHRDLVRRHHERIDGSGYPDGLAHDGVPLLVRIISVVDAYDAMSSDRAYRKALPQEKIIEEIQRGSGKQFDGQIADLLIDLVKNGDIAGLA